MHPRKAIRHAIRDRLKTAVDGAFLTVAGENVYASRMAPVTDDDYPAILIYTREEKDYSEPIDDSVAWRKATLFVVIEGLLRAGESVDDKLDDLAEQIEAAFDGWKMPSFESANMVLHETDVDVVTENVRRPIGAIGLTYLVTYRAPRVAEPVEPIPDEVDSILWGNEPSPLVRPGRIMPIGGPPVIMKFSRDAVRTGGVGDPETTDLDRRAQDIIKFGVIEEVDLEREVPSYRILIGNKSDEDNHIITDWIAAPINRAQGSKEGHFLEKGERVALLSEGGDLATSRIMPAGALTKENKPPTRKPDEWKRRFGNGAVVGYDPEKSEMTLDAGNASGKITMRGQGAVARMSNGKLTVQTGDKADKTGPSNKGKKDDEKPDEQGDADTKFDLNKQMKGLHARIEQLEHTASAQHFATSLLHNLLLPKNPQIAPLLSIFNQAPGGMEEMIQKVTGLLPGYAQSLLKLALGKFEIPTLDSIGGLFAGFLQQQVAALTGSIAAHVAEIANIEGQIKSLTASLENMDPEEATGVIAQIADLKASPVFDALAQAKAALASLQSSIPSAGDFMGSQQNITKGMIESVRFGGAGKQD